MPLKWKKPDYADDDDDVNADADDASVEAWEAYILDPQFSVTVQREIRTPDNWRVWFAIDLNPDSDKRTEQHIWLEYSFPTRECAKAAAVTYLRAFAQTILKRIGEK